MCFFFFQAEDGIRDGTVTGVQTCALPISVRPLWAEGLVGAVSSAAVLGVVWVANSYPLPVNVAIQYAEEHGIPVPVGGLFIPTGVAFPVVIMLIVTLVVTFLA